VKQPVALGGDVMLPVGCCIADRALRHENMFLSGFRMQLGRGAGTMVVCAVMAVGAGMTFLELGWSVGMDVMLRSRVTTEEISERRALRRVTGIMVAVGRVLVGVMAAWSVGWSEASSKAVRDILFDKGNRIFGTLVTLFEVLSLAMYNFC
jgi:hypothetical protein